jgi:hypothetical protein
MAFPMDNCKNVQRERYRLDRKVELKKYLQLYHQISVGKACQGQTLVPKISK